MVSGKAVDPGVVLARGDVETELVTEQVFVEGFLEQLRRNLWIAIFVGQAGPHRIRRIKHVRRDERIRVFAMKPSVHVAVPRNRFGCVRSTGATLLFCPLPAAELWTVHGRQTLRCASATTGSLPDRTRQPRLRNARPESVLQTGSLSAGW